MSGAREPAWLRPRLDLVHVGAFPYPSPQGSQVYVRSLLRALARRGHRVRLVCYGHGEGSPDPGVELVRLPAVPGYRRMRSGPDPVKPLLDAALALRLARVDGDLVHAHNYEGALAALLARRLRPRPVVYGAHTTLGEELHTYVDGPVAAALARRVGRALDRQVPRRADHVVALSEPARPLLASLGCRFLDVVEPGVEVEDLAPVAPAELPRGPWVVYAGNPDRYQDLDVLYAAMARLPEAGLLLVGASPPDAWGCPDLPRVHRVQAADFHEVRRCLSAAAVAALPRATCSGYPVKLLNYLGTGLPTVAAEGVARDLPGVVRVAGRDPVAMAGALRALLDEPARRRRLGREARAHVLQHCTSDARAAELDAVYRTVLERGGA